MSTVFEEGRNIEVFDEAEVLVIGGGPAGTAAAVSAARAGAKTILMERYGFLGGLATGGQVIMIPNVDNGYGIYCGGIMQEWLDRLKACAPDTVRGPERSEAGSTDPMAIRKWSTLTGCVHKNRVVCSYFVDPENLKIELGNMLCEAGVTTYLHCWGARAYMEDGELKGVFFESKEGRKLILAKVIIDATGEGDIFSSAGAECYTDVNPKIRNAQTTEVFRMDHIDWLKFMMWASQHRQEFGIAITKLGKECGFSLMPVPSNRNDQCWVNNWLNGRDSMHVKDLTDVEFTVKRKIPTIIKFFRENIPGFEEAALMDIASLVGVRQSRRIKGMYKVTMDDLLEGKGYEDDIAVTPPMHAFNTMPDSITSDDDEIPMHIPYRALVPETMDNLLIAGRCLSADVEAHNWLNLIPHSVLTGQASGTAAALAVKHGVQPRDVNIRELQTYLKAEGIYLEQDADPDVKVELKEAVVIEDSAAADDFYDMVSGIVNQ